MKTWKLVAGILSIILFVVVTMQSCVVGIGNTLAENGETGGIGGILYLLYLCLPKESFLQQQESQKEKAET